MEKFKEIRLLIGNTESCVVNNVKYGKFSTCPKGYNDVPFNSRRYPCRWPTLDFKRIISRGTVHVQHVTFHVSQNWSTDAHRYMINVNPNTVDVVLI